MREGGREEGREGGREEGGLLASCRLNKRRVKEIEREAIFSLLFFMGCSQKGLNKGSKRQTMKKVKVQGHSIHHP